MSKELHAKKYIANPALTIPIRINNSFLILHVFKISGSIYAGKIGLKENAVSNQFAHAILLQ
jgi:hypothetical protein